MQKTDFGFLTANYGIVRIRDIGSIRGERSELIAAVSSAVNVLFRKICCAAAKPTLPGRKRLCCESENAP